MSDPDIPTPTPTPQPVRRLASARAAWRRPGATTIVAVLLPVLAVLAASFVHTDQETGGRVPPQESSLTRSTLICPPGGSDVAVASVSGASGDVALQAGGDRADLAVSPDRASAVDVDRRSLVISGSDDLAPGLVANRYERPWASADCRPPVVDQWFTGVGAGAKHQSTLQLVNPDAGRAVVDIVVLGRRGEVAAPTLRGLAISGGETRILDLAEIIPRRDDLALHVTTLRGRVSASVLDKFQELGRGQGGQDGLASQDEPSMSNLLLGLTAGRGQRTLIIANPTDDEGRATVRLVTADSVFVPAGAKDVVLPPQSVVRVGLAPLLRGTGQSDKARPYGVQVDSTVEATVGLVMFVEGDLAQGVPTPPLAGPATVVLPQAGGGASGKDSADKQLVLGGASAPGVVTVELWDEDGRSLKERRIEIAPGRGYLVPLPSKARLMTLTPDRATVSGVVLVTGDGATLVRVREPVLTGLEPYVGAGLP